MVVRHEVLKAEELHELREPVAEFKEVRMGVGDIGEGALWFSCVVTPDTFKDEVYPVADRQAKPRAPSPPATTNPY